MATKTKDAPATNAPRLKTDYFATWQAELAKELGITNIHNVPRLEKVVVNCGLGKSKDDKRMREVAANTLTKITGQAPVATIATKSIASFKLREGDFNGLKVTLRGNKMYEFTDRVISLVLPRLRDFHGTSVKAFDTSGNYSIGLRDQSVFPELTFDETSVPHGLQVVFVIKSQEPKHSKALLEKFGMPFEKKEMK